VTYHCEVPSLKNASAEDLLAEPSLFKASASFIEQLKGASLTKEILRELKKQLTEDEYERLQVDVKVQYIPVGAFSNYTGWHADFYAIPDETTKRLVRPNEGLEAETRVFLITSGEPATEFIRKPNLVVDMNVPSWDELSQKIDAQITPQDLYRIPIATLVEMKGDEIHRVTPNETGQTTLRYFLRAVVFPQKHTQHGKFFNELYNWSTHVPKPEYL
jgi:hypothetical protein